MRLILKSPADRSTRLEIYVADGCTTCAESARLAAAATASYPEITHVFFCLGARHR